MASTADCTSLLETIYDETRLVWPTPELAAARALIDEHNMTNTRAAHLIELSMKDGFFRGKAKTAGGLLANIGGITALEKPLLRRGVQEPVGSAYQRYTPPPPDEAKPYHTWGDDRNNLTPEQREDFVRRRNILAAKIDAAIAAGCTGPAIGRYCGVDVGNAMANLVADAHSRPLPNGSTIAGLLKQAAEQTREAREAQEQINRANALKALHAGGVDRFAETPDENPIELGPDDEGPQEEIGPDEEEATA